MLNNLRHIVTLKKQNGEIYENIKAEVQPKLIFIKDSSIPIEENDIIEFIPSNNLKESYIVLDRGFYEARGSFPAHYQVNYHRQSRWLDWPHRGLLHALL